MGVIEILPIPLLASPLKGEERTSSNLWVCSTDLLAEPLTSLSS
jgi:hypothetical protein